MELINLGESSHMCAALIMYDGWQIAQKAELKKCSAFLLIAFLFIY